MKKYLAMLCAAMLCVCCLALAACGGGASSSAAASSAASSSSAAASSSAASSSAAATATLPGTWKIAAIESQGAVIAGNFDAFLSENASATQLVLKEDGTGEFSLGENTAQVKWESADNKAVKLTVEGAEGTTEVNATLEGDALKLDMTDSSSGELNGNLVLSKDGTYAGAKIIDMANAKDVTSEKDLIGTWNLCGLNMMGMSAYGDMAALQQISGNAEAADMTVVFEEGGKVILTGQEATYTVGPDGTTIDIAGIVVPVKMNGNELYVDLTETLGMEMCMCFEK